MKTYIKLILLGLVAFIFSSCISLVSKEKLNEWALSNSYILAKNCPKLVVPPREAQPHPEVPMLEVRDADGNYIPITEEYLMKIIIKLFGTIQKFQYLVEIYEREYLNAGGKIMPDLTLEELKALYLKRLNTLDSTPISSPEPEPEQPIELTTEGKYPTTGAGVPNVEEMTLDEFAILVDAFYSFQESIKPEGE